MDPRDGGGRPRMGRPSPCILYEGIVERKLIQTKGVLLAAQQGGDSGGNGGGV